ncbi:DUF6491 family protein [Gilvimarinus xylanilyticus]|uniref:DUF6491 family protein n=1 Tax=Gilvimarinus xylanilyticus TaxID=2944139 RepID=A0A9X2HWE9_9GAMM|nr:DUF6491 family protein [Gilvimarinus xylanilyticus]MCP8899643.1 DUF6491 family protein [Gilvimarinus xylanilyticus]
MVKTTHSLLPLTTTALFAAAITACSTTGGPSTNVSSLLLDATGQNGRACLDVKDIRGYGVLDGDVISINTNREYYLATVLPGCMDLQMSTHAMFKQRFGEICGGGMDSVRTGGDNCTIRNIFEFENRESAFAVHDQVMEKQAELREAARAQ